LTKMQDSRRLTAGFTLLELLTAIAVLAIVTALAVPGMRAFTQNNRAASQANEFLTALNLARSEAVTRGIATTICASTDGSSCSGDESWNSGWLVFVDRAPPLGEFNPGPGSDTLLRAWPELPAGSSLASNRSELSWRPDGFIAGALATTFELRIPDCSGDQARNITVSPQGRASVSRIDCDSGN